MDIDILRDIAIILFAISTTIALVLNIRRIERLEAKLEK